MNIAPKILGRPMNMELEGSGDNRWTLDVLLSTAWRRRRVILAAALAALAVALAYLAMTPSRYTATAVLMTDTRRTPPSPTEITPESAIDPAVIESQIETLKSETIAIAVIDKLRLWDDPEFVGAGPGLLARGLAAIGLLGSDTPSVDVRRRAAIASFKRQLTITRVGHSYVTEISFNSLDPKKAADIANEVAEAYIQDQLGAKLSNAQRAVSWMRQRIEEVRREADAAAQAVARFKAAHDGATASVSAPSEGGADQDAGRTLRDLEAAAQTQRAVYDSLVNRYARVSQFMQQQTLPITEARVMTAATPPLAKTSPKSGVTLMLALLAGGTLGLMGAVGREYVRRSVGGPEQAERELGVRCFGLVDFQRKSGTRAGGRNRNPSEDTLRRLKLALVRDAGSGEGRAVGFISPRLRDARTKLAYATAVLLAAQDRRVLLIDGDLHASMLTRLVAPKVENGLSTALRNGRAVTDSIVRSERGFDLLGAGPRPAGLDPSDLLGSRDMQSLLLQLRKIYDYVLIDLPPMLDGVDVAAVSGFVDAFVLVLDEDTPTDDVWHALKVSDVASELLLGTVVGKGQGSPPAGWWGAIGRLPVGRA